MPKDQFREIHVAKDISAIKFCVDSPSDMQMHARLQIFQTNMYDQGPRTPVPYGVLDRRLGSLSNAERCETCGETLTECSGHYGYIDLELPVFHVGYFNHILNILRCICKSCACVLLDSSLKNIFRKRFQNPGLSYMGRKNLRKKVLVLCKKVRKCPNCSKINGTVKKATAAKGGAGGSVLKIVHEISKGNERNEFVLQEMARIKRCVASNPNLQNCVVDSLTENLTPIDVLALFKRIPEQDVWLLAMKFERSKPEDLILTRMLVPPIAIRPSVISELKAGTNEDDLSVKQSEILFINDCIRKHKLSGASVNMFLEGWDFLQLQTALYFNSELSGVPLAMMPSKKPGRGLVQRLKGKQGRFRGNLSGKRVDFTARTVISPDPNLEIDQVGVPKHIAKILTFPEMVFPGNISFMRQLVMNGPDKWPGANYIQQKNGLKKYLKYGNREKMAQELRVGDLVERHLFDGDVVLFNRQPSLHRLSIMSHRAKIHDNRTLRFNECCCNPYNADFDGDEMNLHLPQTLEAKAEAEILLGNKHNLVTPRNGELLIAAIQDFITGAYLISRKDTFFDWLTATQLAAILLASKDTSMDVQLPPPCIIKPKCLWSGKQIISLIFQPNKQNPVKANLEAPGKGDAKKKEFCVKDTYILIRNSELLAGTLTKTNLGSGGKEKNIFYIILKDYGTEFAIRAMSRIARLTSYYLMRTGFSIGIGDVTPSENLLHRRRSVLKNGYMKCDEFISDLNEGKLRCQPGCTANESLESMLLNELSSIRDACGQVCLEELPQSNAPLIMTLSGSKGSVINISQMVTCVAQQAVNGKRVPEGFDSRSLPHFRHSSISPEAKGFVENSFRSGMIPTEMFFHTMGGREGLVDTAVKTAETGYMQRRLVKVLEDLVVSYDGTVRNAERDVVQVNYGGDSLDPMYMEGNGVPTNFERVFNHVKAKYPYRDEEPLTSDQIKRATTAFLSTDALNECSEDFKNELKMFMKKIEEKVESVEKIFGNCKVANEIERLTCSQLVTFLETCGQKYLKSVVESGTAVGALAAQSIGEPGTQMTLKTFHFAGVASMNITQGVPRLKEIMNATPNISTPIIQASLVDSTNYKFAQAVRNRIQKTTLEEIATKILECAMKDMGVFIVICLDFQRMCELEINVDTVKYSLCTSKLKLKANEVKVESKTIISVKPDRNYKKRDSIFVISDLLIALPKVMVKGYTTINKAVVVNNDDNTYNLCVEGNNLREVLATYGVDANKTRSNNVIEVYRTLGIEAARETIMNEIMLVMENHSISVDFRHVMLLAAQMTHTGEVLGVTRHGLAKMKESVFNLASFEKTADHLFDAAFYGQTDKISGVSENIIVGSESPVGTGTFKLLQKTNYIHSKQDSDPLLFVYEN
ncbi:DNA-directed RNA polymerase III subunit RPC1 [Coccinella septempunctata]|uniref:DNA-directed RNA polymerase III subunit RPC1 n=1 Tax=Coccinella septempunctata TaxID=41139 RepID=UPI001D08D70A|nr:DNA-directed RNA polymerase III subunit RPC1 [Coccinella septempunctata]